MLSIFSLTCLYGIILGVFLDKISWKVVDYKREQRRQPDAGKGDDEQEGKQDAGKGDDEKEEGEREQRREPDAGKGDDEKEEGEREPDAGKGDDEQEGEREAGKGDDEKEEGEREAGKGDDEKEEGEREAGEREQRRQPDAGKGDDEKEGKREAGKRAKELSLHCADDRSRKLARILLPILHLLLCGIGGGILALNETIPLTVRVTLAIVFCLFVSIALISSWVDILIRIIPNEIVLTIAAFGIVFRIVCAIVDPWSLLGGFASFALTLGMFSLAMFIGRKRWNSRGVGAGDFKLAMIASFIVGFPGIAYFYMALCVAMLVYFVYMIARGSFGFFVWFPMCSFLMIALLVGLIYSYIPGVPLLF